MQTNTYYTSEATSMTGHPATIAHETLPVATGSSPLFHITQGIIMTREELPKTEKLAYRAILLHHGGWSTGHTTWSGDAVKETEEAPRNTQCRAFNCRLQRTRYIPPGRYTHIISPLEESWPYSVAWR